jgi:5'-3' exonuclease
MIALIDGDSLIYYEAFKDQTLEEAQRGIDKRLSFMLNTLDTDRYIGFLTGSKNFRYQVAKSKGYKSSRPKEKPDLLIQIKQYMQDALQFKIVDGLEADDLVVYWHKQMEEETTICSPDKDVLKQTRGVHYDYRWAKDGTMGRFVTTSGEEAEKFLWKQVLMGDSTDDIPGIPGVGEKRANLFLAADPKTRPYEQVVLQQYILIFGVAEGVSRFAETFKLVYMLQTPEDVMREVGIKLEKPDISIVKL